MKENNQGLKLSADSVGLPLVRPRGWHRNALQHLRLRSVGAAGHERKEKKPTGLGGSRVGVSSAMA